MIPLTWTIWIVALFILNIIFMNFFIAVIIESYQKFVETLEAETYRVKAVLISEREALLVNFNEEERHSYFPEYLILRSKV